MNEMNRFQAAVSAAVLLAAISGWGCKGKSPDAAQATPEPPAARAVEDAGLVRLSAAQLRDFGVEPAPAVPGKLLLEVVLPGEVALNSDRLSHVVPRVSGVVREVRKNLGDTVRRGEVMAVLESRELADSIAVLLAARERLILAQSNFNREEQVWTKKISPEQDFIQAKNSLAEANIALRTAEHKLRALGFSDDYIARLPVATDKTVITYEMTAPFDATVIEKHISLGEVLKDDSPAFLIADLSTVWVNLDVHQRDLPLVKVGQTASIGVGNETGAVQGKVSLMDPMATETNRTIHARVVVRNPDGRLRPGLFVTGRINAGEVDARVVVRNEALVMVDGRPCVFVREKDGYRLQPVTAGRASGGLTEIVAGLTPGQEYAAKGAFTLKSELRKPEEQ